MRGTTQTIRTPETPQTNRVGRADGETWLAVAVFAALALLPLVTSGYPIYILPQYMLFGVLAMSLCLLWGFLGMVSFGQAGFFALGAYMMGIAMQWMASPVNPAYLGLILAVILGGGLAALIGAFLFTAGVRGAYFVIVTLALSIIVEQLAVSQSQITGGWNGMFIDRFSLTFGPLGEISLYNDAPVYYVVLTVVALIYALLKTLSGARSGKILIGIRENEDRLISLGFTTAWYKTAAFALSGAIACLAGALYGSHANFVAPSLGGVLFSTEVVVWVAIGGRHSLLGALLGGILVASLSNYLSAIMPSYWQLALGILFVLAILFFRGGAAGAIARVWEHVRERPR
ncbi:MAG: branched-chain amino acid ABC transporter permease [Geminicoccales bacterium]